MKEVKDLYEVLGVEKDATKEVIKKAYRKLAMGVHPDKGGDENIMKALNEAYETLGDEAKRRGFDAKWRAYQSTECEPEEKPAVTIHIQACNTKPYSQSFKQQHAELVKQFEQTPMNTRLKEPLSFKFAHNEEHKSVYSAQQEDIFSFIRAKREENPEPLTNKAKLKNPLSPIEATTLFMKFLSGQHYKKSTLEAMTNELAVKCRELRLKDRTSHDLMLYEGIFEIISMTENSATLPKNLIYSLKKITDFAKTAPDNVLSQIIPLFYNKFFRNLYAQALHLYWQSHEDAYKPEKLSQFDGFHEAKDLIHILKERLANANFDENLPQLIQYISLLSQFDKDLNYSAMGAPKSQSAEHFRKLAFHSLDWIPVLIGSKKEVIANVFLQIGIKFQQASLCETQPAMKMADEKIALKLFLTALEVGTHSTPDLELYVGTQILHYMSAFQFQDELLPNILKALKERTVRLTDFFPFFESPQSNIAFLRQEHKMLHVMRKLLHVMLDIHEHNKSHPQDQKVIDHSITTLLYQAYEACLKNWYQEEHDSELEKKFRLDLMEALLSEKGWNFSNVESLLNSPEIMVARDEDGWLKPTRALPFPSTQEFPTYSSINGAEIDERTGGISIYLTQWTPDKAVNEKVFSLFDVEEMFHNGTAGAIFSLDPVDPNKPYHPFNCMRYAPANLQSSELLHTMLLTDYILKFVTTNQEVLGQFPFKERAVDAMIQHLPDYLRHIIDEFHASHRPGALHRFWIEAEQVDVHLSDKPNTEGLSIVLGDLKMTVKKHRMERDVHGELKDVGNEDEGWPIYILTEQQFAELEQKTRVIESHAMLFIEGQTQLIYWENNTVIHAHHHLKDDASKTLVRLYKLERGSDGRVIQNAQNTSLLYRVTMDMANQAKFEHRYSPEFIFAHKFSIHYDEFAQYLPEFGRLKELTKLSVLIRNLKGIRLSNQESLEALNSLLSSQTGAALETESYKKYQAGIQTVRHNIINLFEEWRSKLSAHALNKKWHNELSGIRAQIGTLTFSNDSYEVNEVCNKLHAQILDLNPGVLSKRIWREAINPQRTKIAQQMSQGKQQSCRSQLRSLFSSQLEATLGSFAFNGLIESFMLGNSTPLAEALINWEKTQALQAVSKQFPNRSPNDLARAIEDSSITAAMGVAIAESTDQLLKQKKSKENLEAGFVGLQLGTQEDGPATEEEQCVWVPASVKHEVSPGRQRHSIFVYGGVSLQPNINVVRGSNAPLSGNAVNGSAFRTNTSNTVLYQKVGPQGEHLKFGITKNPATRYSAEELGGGRLKIIAQGARADMLALERNVHSTLPIGPQERQSAYINIQAAKGYKVPPYR